MNIAARDSSFEAPAYLGRLNDEQRLAVMHGDGKVAAPLLVIAGAGSGKTMTLAARVARLVLEGADPQRILLLDPIQKHPTWIDARNDSSGDSEMHGTVDSKHGELLHGAVAS